MIPFSPRILDPNPALFFGQSGEDLVLAHLFPTKNGTFVEIGCIDGLRFSNTLHFARNGWTGICVEAHRDYIPLLRQNRPESRVLHTAVGATNLAAVPFFANARGSLSTLERDNERRFRAEFGPWFTGFTEQTVPLRTLSSILDEMVEPCVDFVSIDVEGSELAVLAGIDFERHRPKVILAEADDDQSHQAIHAHLAARKYRYLGRVANNVFFAEQGFRPGIEARPAQLSGFLAVTPHPLDQDELRVRECCFWWPQASPDPGPVRGASGSSAG